MKKLKLFIATLLTLSTLSFSIKTYNANSSDYGIFKDLTSSEVSNYYSTLSNGLKGDALLSALQDILKVGQKSITSSNAGSSWKLYLLLDRNYEKDPLREEEISSQKWKEDNVICSPLYDDELIYKSSEKPGTYFIDREHVFPKSYGFASKSTSSDFYPYAGTDMHNLHMGEKANNGTGHNNYPYGDVDKSQSYKEITSKISGNVTGYLGVNNKGIPVYEPMDKDKGDIARSIFYMAARYHTYDPDVQNSPALKLSDTPTDVYSNKNSLYAEDTENNPCEYGILSDLLKWNELDPVDDHEIHRNNLVYNAVQYNRNPFIDYPSWAEIAFGNSNNGIDLGVTPRLVGDGGGSVTPVNPDPQQGESGQQEEPSNPTTPTKSIDFEELIAKYWLYFIIAGVIIVIIIIIIVIAASKNKKVKKAVTKQIKNVTKSVTKSTSKKSTSSKKK